MSRQADPISTTPVLAAVVGAEAASLAVMSALHLTGVLGGDSSGAGIAEAVICVVLVFAAVALACRFPQARAIALGAVTFAIFGFVIGLGFTVTGGGVIDLAYHATVLPLLVATLLVVRAR